MALHTLCLALALGFLVQSGTVPPTPGPDGLLDSERARLQHETKLDGRIKVYDAASSRYQTSLTKSLGSQSMPDVPSQLKSWANLLESSLKDIEGSTARKDKSKALIHFEIHLRKAISDMQELRLKAPIDQFSDFESWLAKAEEVHKKFVDMLFQR